MQEDTSPIDDLETPGQQVIGDTLALARMIADLCITSRLKSHGAVECALDIARRLVEANACEDQIRRDGI